MDIFKFNNPTSPTKMEQGEIVNGFTSKMWIERYLKEGEFTLKAPASSGLREKLPTGSFISHVNSTEIMIVENHEINDNKDTESEIVITGRGFETFLENRIVGSNRTFPVSEDLVDYPLAADYTWNQAVNMLSDHLSTSALIDDDNQLPFTSITTTVPGTESIFARAFQRQPLYDALMSLLSVDNLGIKVTRPGSFSPLGIGSPNLLITIHKGVDKTASVIFSYDTGEIENADYLWSIKRLKNAALVVGRWVETAVIPVATGYQRRWMIVDAKDVDQDFTAPPAGTDLTSVNDSMYQKGLEALSSQNELTLTKAEVSSESVKFVYRIDYDVGDLVTVMGSYNEVAVMRVSEYVEIEDETGERGYPTLSVD